MGGVLVWFFFHLRLFPFYPGGVHAEIMIGGFYLTIAAGFLMTAIPRLSGTATASTVEKTAALLASLAGFAVVWKTNRFFFHAILLLQLLLLIRFATKRLFKGPFAPAPPFVLTAFGNLSALAGIVILLINDFHPCSPPLLTAARGLFFYGFFLGGVLGIGSLLIPMILGAGNLPQSPTPLSTTVSRLPHIGKFSLLGLSLAGSFFVDAYVGIRWGSLIRAIVVGILLLKWPLFQRPPKGILYWMLWLSGWILLVGFWPAVLRPDLALHTNHTIFIGTVSLMIFGIATRVTLAHG
ncbi:MAG: NnrS family protein, partial [Deltaproteobacteria bacterium]|nr:NnrS family protein [Deltaproteobacteria bacterium]